MAHRREKSPIDSVLLEVAQGGGCEDGGYGGCDGGYSGGYDCGGYNGGYDGGYNSGYGSRTPHYYDAGPMTDYGFHPSPDQHATPDTHLTPDTHAPTVQPHAPVDVIQVIQQAEQPSPTETPTAHAPTPAHDPTPSPAPVPIAALPTPPEHAAALPVPAGAAEAGGTAHGHGIVVAAGEGIPHHVAPPEHAPVATESHWDFDDAVPVVDQVPAGADTGALHPAGVNHVSMASLAGGPGPSVL